MSISNEKAEFWPSTAKGFAGHRRRNSSSCLLTSAGGILSASSRYLGLAKLHSDSMGIGLNALRLPTLPKGTLFRSSLPATPLSTPMYTSILQHFTEQDIQNLLAKKSSTPKVFKSMSQHENLYEEDEDEEEEVPATASGGLAAALDCREGVRTRLFNEPSISSSILTRANAPAPYKMDSKPAKELKAENPKQKIKSQDDEEIVKEEAEIKTQENSLYLSINEGSADNTLEKDELELSESLTEQATLIPSTNTKHKTSLETTEKSVEDKQQAETSLVTEQLLNKSKHEQVNGDQSKSTPRKKYSNGNDIMTENLFVSGLDFNTTDRHLKETFGQYGKVLTAKVIIDKITKKSKNFGFVNVVTPSNVDSIFQVLPDQIYIGKRKIQVNRARERSHR